MGIKHWHSANTAGKSRHHGLRPKHFGLPYSKVLLSTYNTAGIHIVQNNIQTLAMTCNTLDGSGLQNGLFYIAKRGISRH